MRQLAVQKNETTPLGVAVTFFIFLFVSAQILSANANEPTIGDAEKGKQLSQVCVACHGEGGQSVVPNFPKLAGQHPAYLLKQMRDMRPNKDNVILRNVVEMQGIIAGFSEQDLMDLAAYYAAQKESLGQAEKQYVELGQKIYRAGIPKINIPACSACHSPTGDGNKAAGYPKLRGQFAAYTEKSLKAFRDGSRTNDAETQVMRNIAERLSDAEIKAVSSYISGLY